jgi:hypothetical protein
MRAPVTRGTLDRPLRVNGTMERSMFPALKSFEMPRRNSSLIGGCAA